MTNTVGLDVQDRGWSNIWRLKVPNKILDFLWLVRHEKLACNAGRKRRHLTSEEHCFMCTSAKESVEHIIRWCPKARNVWSVLMGSREFQRQANWSFRQWLDANIEGRVRSSHGDDWPCTFAMACWWNWRWRNELVFTNTDKDETTRVEWIRQYAKDIMRAFSKQGPMENFKHTWGNHHLRWQRPDQC